MGNKSEKRRKERAPFTYIKIMLLRCPLYNILFDKKKVPSCAQIYFKTSEVVFLHVGGSQVQVQDPKPKYQALAPRFPERDSNCCYAYRRKLI